MQSSGDRMSPGTSSTSMGMGAIRMLSGREGYSAWKFKMRFYLLHEQLWEAVVGYPDGDGTPEQTKNRKDELALAKICMTLDGGAITHVRSAESAKAAWTSLQNAYEDKGMGRKLALERKLYRFCLDEFNDMEMYIQAIMNTALDLADIGKIIEDTSLAAILLGGLTPKYDPLVMALENSNVKVTTELVKGRLLSVMSKTEDTIPALRTVAKKKPKKVKAIVCYDCKQPGHKGPDCPLRKSNGGKDTKDASLLALGLGDTEALNNWFIDSGASQHMTSRRDWFTNLKPKDSEVFTFV